MSNQLSVISSMATRLSLATLIETFRHHTGRPVDVLSIGGLDAARRVRSGERFDVVVLAGSALAGLAADGFVEGESIRVFALSPTAVAVAAGAALPDRCDAATIRDLVVSGGAIGVSTGPSGAALRKVMEQWGLGEAVTQRFVEAPPGIPVARLIANGDVDVGFQQLSEMAGEPGIAVVGTVPADLIPLTAFSMGRATSCADCQGADLLIDFLASPVAKSVLQSQGLVAPQ